MLTIEMLSQNPALASLSDAQRAAIAEMSKNDEATVIGTRIGALHGQYDTDILTVSGITKNAGEKSYDYAKRVISDFKSKVEAAKNVQAQLDAANKKVEDLQKKIESNAGDETLRQQLKDAKAQVGQLQTQLKASEDSYKQKTAELEGKIKSTHVDYAFAAATAGFKFKDGITESVQKVLLNSAKAEVLAKGTPDFVDDGQGGQKLVFRGADGNILNNAKNNLNPYTAEELLMETSIKDVIDTGRQQTGGGTKGGNGGNGGGTSLDLTGVKTQVEADKAIETYLLSTGLTRDSSAFSQQSMQLRNENNISSLPIR